MWAFSGISFNLDGDVCLKFQDFLWHLKFRQQIDEELLGLVYTVAWCLWFNRNEVRHGKVWSQASVILQKAHYLLNDFQTANFKLNQPAYDDIVQW